MSMRQWVKLPSAWIEGGGLHAFKWHRDEGASQTAALMVLLAIAHRAELDDGSVRVTYDELTRATHLSRTKVADGLDILADRGLILRQPKGRSTFQLANYCEGSPWAALPAKPLYDRDGAIRMFEDFHLRKVAELDALKLYLAFATRRDTKANVARMTYDMISGYADIPGGRIKRALGILNIDGLISVERHDREGGLAGMAHGYRLCHLFPRLHAGTTGRTSL